MKYLPSKKFLLLLGALVIVGGMIFFASGGNELFKGVVFDRTADGGTVVVVPGGGLSSGDWQSALNNVATGNSSGNTGSLGASSVKKSGSGSQNLTDSLTQGIIAKVPQLQVQGGLDPQAKQQLVSSVLKDVPDGTAALVHTSGELSVYTTTNSADLKAYGNALANIFTSYASKFRATGYELAIVDAAIQANDGSSLKKLLVVEDLYKSMVKELVAMKVPKDVSLIHLNIINAYEVIVASLHDLESVISDPVKGLSGITHYKAGSQTIQSNVVNLNGTFNLRGVVFGSGEAGAIFSQASRAAQ